MANNIVRIKGTPNLVEIGVSKKQDTCHYTLKSNGKTIFKKESELPVSLGINTQVAREIRKLIDPDNRLNKDTLKEDFSNFMLKLQEKYEALVESLEEEHEKAVKAEIENLTEKKLLASEMLSQIDEPLIWLGSLIDWMTAGERNNILITFLAYCSQVILGNPISLIALGDAGSGKTHIQEEAMNLIPAEFILNEKKITEAALFNRAKSDEHFYDGKIVNYGDMGGANDQSFAEESKALMKELQSDGFLNKPLNVPSPEGGWVVEDLKLKGKPCLTYTTVPGYDFDDQELSRSIFVTPRMDNKKQFESRLVSLELKGKSYYKMIEYCKKLDYVKYMVYSLKDKLEEVIIINPYASILVEYLGNSKHYKRDYPKYDGLIKIIAALNYHNHDIYSVNNEKRIYCTLKDVAYFMSLIKPYKLSIVTNLSPKATEILQELIDDYSNPDRATKHIDICDGVTINDYMEWSELNLSKSSISSYFKELDKEGFLRLIDKRNKEFVYQVTEKALDNTDVDLKLDEASVKQLEHEVSNEELNIIFNDSLDDDVDVMSQHKDVDAPYWKF